MKFLKRRSIHDLTPPAAVELRKRTRIVVIDDDPHSFPFDTLKREGYSIDHWPRVENLHTLEEGHYDIIFLDIQGVAKEYSKDDGLGILEHLKQANPSQIVVAFSAHSYDLSKNRFWQLADDSLSKPVDAAKCKEIIDNLIENKLTPLHYWKAIAELLRHQGLTDRQVRRIENKFVRAIVRKDKEAVDEIFRSAVKSTEVVARFVGIASKIAALLGL